MAKNSLLFVYCNVSIFLFDPLPSEDVLTATEAASVVLQTVLAVSILDLAFFFIRKHLERGWSGFETV